MGDGAGDEMLMMLRANVTFFGWQPVLFSMVSSGVFESELGWRHSSLLLPVLTENTVVTPRATLAVFDWDF